MQCIEATGGDLAIDESVHAGEGGILRQYTKFNVLREIVRVTTQPRNRICLVVKADAVRRV